MFDLHALFVTLLLGGEVVLDDSEEIMAMVKGAQWSVLIFNILQDTSVSVKQWHGRHCRLNMGNIVIKRVIFHW